MHPTLTIRYILSLTLLVAAGSVATAQLKVFPAERAPAERTLLRANSTARVESVEPLTLPFFDDFSKPYARIYPDTLRWENSYSVWVNDGMAIRPPTINVATFDGLSRSGAPYSQNDVLLTGYADTLTSRPIDLTADGGVSEAERTSVYLSFFYQWQGYVEAPDASDFLEIQFKTADAWQTVKMIFPEEESDPTVFLPVILPVTDAAYFHAGFQFRIRSYGRLSGPYDAWHVDYVYLNKGRNANDLSFPDRAIATYPGPLFGAFHAIPRWHLFSNEQFTPPHFDIRNMKNQEASINFRTIGLFSHTNTETGATTSQEVVLGKATPINITDNVLFAREHRTIWLDTLPDLSDPLQFPADPAIDSTLIRLTVALQTRDNVPLNKQPPIEPDSTGDYTENYRPIRFTTNDTVTVDYVLSSYYAYDDGIAEYGAGLLEAGNLVAYAFDIDTTYALKQDTLIGFDVYFPPYAVTSNQSIDFLVFEDDPENPGFPGDQLVSIRRTIRRRGLNQFQHVAFLPALLIDKGRFYIGWRHPQQGRAIVGLDISNNTSERIFVNTAGFWYQNEDVQGSLMIRPVFGSGQVDTTVGVDDEEPAPEPYPNPAAGVFWLDAEIDDLTLYSLTGVPVAFELFPGPQRTEVRVPNAAAGMYLLRYRAANRWHTRKLLIRRP